MNLPSHLGGHLNKTHIDEGVLKFFFHEFNCRSFIDIGCGPGGQCEKALELGYNPSIGIDGDFTLDRSGLKAIYIEADYTKDKVVFDQKIDLVWSCEFVEHVEEKYIPNFISTFKSANWVAMTYCPPQNKPNLHHFNEQPESYWINVFEENGFKYNKLMTEEARNRSTMEKPFFKERGLIFKNDN